MPSPRQETPSGGDAARSRVLGILRRGVRWLRDLHRGYAYTGHLPRRRD